MHYSELSDEWSSDHGGVFSGAVGTLNPGQNLHSLEYRYHSWINDKPSGTVISDDICTTTMFSSLVESSVLLAIHT